MSKYDRRDCCCTEMFLHLSEGDVPIVYSLRFREYGIKINDGGTSFQEISYCPWCGSKLPNSLRREWFDRIEKLGLDPFDANIPSKMLSDSWWKSEPKELE